MTNNNYYPLRSRVPVSTPGPDSLIDLNMNSYDSRQSQNDFNGRDFIPQTWKTSQMNNGNSIESTQNVASTQSKVTQVKHESRGHTYTSWKACRTSELLNEVEELRDRNSQNENIIEELKWKLNERKALYEEVTKILKQELNAKDDHMCRLIDEVAKLSGLVKLKSDNPIGGDVHKEASDEKKAVENEGDKKDKKDRENEDEKDDKKDENEETEEDEKKNEKKDVEKGKKKEGHELTQTPSTSLERKFKYKHVKKQCKFCHKFDHIARFCRVRKKLRPKHEVINTSTKVKIE